MNRLLSEKRSRRGKKLNESVSVQELDRVAQSILKKHQAELPSWKEMRKKYENSFYNIDDYGYMSSFEDYKSFGLNILEDIPENIIREIVSTITKMTGVKPDQGGDYDMLMYWQFIWDIDEEDPIDGHVNWGNVDFSE